MFRARRLSLLVATPMLLGVSSFVACSAPERAPTDALRRDFPEQADAVLALSRTFEGRVEGGFVARASRGVTVALPARGDDAIVFTVGQSHEIELRETQTSGVATRTESAVRYPRAHGAAYWGLHERGAEEWLLVDPEGVVRGEPVATWTVKGGHFADVEGVVAVIGDDGRAMLRVEAETAFTEGGEPVDVELAVEGDRLALRVDADHERVLVDPFWIDASSMTTPRSGHVATRLGNGRVLVYGGVTTGGARTATAEAYDPLTNLWLPRDPMPFALDRHAGAPLVSNGGVVTMGGFNGDALNTARQYDFTTNSWLTISPGLNQTRYDHSATLLPDGRIFVFGGTFNGVGEIFDPTTALFTATATSAQAPRSEHTATLLADGRVLLAGGSPGVATAEIYDPGSDSFSPAASMNESRMRFGSIGLPDGRVLVSGGSTTDLTSAEVYDPTSDTWAYVGSMSDPRARHTLSPLPDGRVLAVGGFGDLAGTTATTSVEFYDPGLDQWSPAPTLAESRGSQSATPLPDGSVLVAGGRADAVVVRQSAERFTLLADLGEACQFDVDCATGFCSDGACCNEVCDGECNACSVAAGATTPGVCETLDATPCTGGTCSFGTCVPDLLPNGDLCNGGAECQSGFCTDGVCCDSACNDISGCTACSVVAGAAQDGICSATVGFACINTSNCSVNDVCNAAGLCVASDPECPVTECLEANFCSKGTCSPTERPDGTLCSGDGSCLGGVCIPPVLFPDGTECIDGAQCDSDNCVDLVCCNTACVGECVACSTAEGADVDGVCAPLTDGTPCTGGACAAGLCVQDSLGALGDPCADASECESDFCADGVCCNGACDGDCDACSVDAGADVDGECTGATGRACDDGDACTQTDTCEAGTCQGADPVACTPGPCQVSSSCGEAGTCVAVSKPDGAPCDAGICFAGACVADPDVGNLSGSGSGNPSGAGPGGTSGDGSGPSGTASGPGSGNGSGDGSGSGDDGDVDGAESTSGCSVAREGRGAVDLAWIAVAVALGARWRGTRRRDAGEGRRVAS